MAPPFEFLQRSYGRALAQMGVTLDLQLQRCGFYPAGGGEIVARKALDLVRDYLKSGAAVGEYLADQLLLPMALAGSGSFTVGKISQHAHTNAAVIQQFLPVDVRFTPQNGQVLCEVAGRA